MKKILLVLLAASMLILGVACGKDEQKDKDDDSQSSDFVWPGSSENPITLPEDRFE